MSFTGSQRLDERRRRRLASEDSVCGETSISADLPAEISYRVDQPAATTSDQASLPLQLWLSRSLWKHLAIVFLAWATGAALLVGSHFAELLSHSVGPGVLRLLGPAPAPLVRGYSGLLLLAAAQFAVVVCWVRASSTADFSGSYWIWLRSGMAAFCCSVAVTTGCAPAWSESVKWAIQRPFWNDSVLLWLWPVLLVGGALFWGLCNEMRQSRGSWMTLSFAAVCYLVAAVWCLDLIPTTDPLWGLASVDGLALTGHTAMLLSFSLHARYVIHFSAEPAPRRKKSGIARPHFGWMFRRKAKIELAAADVEGEKKPRATRKRKEVEAEKTPKAATQEAKSPRRRTVTETTEESQADEPVTTKAIEPVPPVSGVGEKSDPKPRPAVREGTVAEAPSPVAAPQAPIRPGAAALGRGLSGTSEEAQTPLVFNRPAPAPVAPAAPAKPATPIPAPAPVTPVSEQNAETDPDSENGDQNDSPELRGLSRKQRRKLEQQMRREGR